MAKETVKTLTKEPTKAGASPTIAGTRSKVIEVPEVVTVRDLATLAEISPIDLIKQLMANGIMANINQPLDFDTAAIVLSDLGFEPRLPRSADEEIPEEPAAPAEPATATARFIAAETEGNLKPRPPVVTVLGHVDHGKTSLLDAFRQTHVASGEAGGITQHIGAYQIEKEGKKITFIDTPGHAAFTAMRARGAQVTDIAILVVAADDGVMPQTIEALDHARAAHVPIIVALNKIDKANAQPDRVKQQLADRGLLIEEWGGDTMLVAVSARTHAGIEDLLSGILLVAEDANLRANPDRFATGTVIESRMDKSRGALATLLIQNGTLSLGDTLVIGPIIGRIRAMEDQQGKRLKSALPSTPVVVLGLPQVPQAGDVFQVYTDERSARQVAAGRAAEQRQTVSTVIRPQNLEEMFAALEGTDLKEFNIVLKADVQGSLQPIQTSLERLGDEKHRIKILRQAIGNISENDVNLAVASDAMVVGFNVEADSIARELAETRHVAIRRYSIIYELLEEMAEIVKGEVKPEFAEVQTGKGEIRAVFEIAKRGKIAGVFVTEGTVYRNGSAIVKRGGRKIGEGRLSSLKRFQDDAREVATGYECGLMIDGANDMVQGDTLEFYRKERIK
ncbi:MAG: translation initiation factor IF-2 [Chloroflexi bacterium]|nr:translation initiation factor IF-2 [Chloroflexota bacterium]